MVLESAHPLILHTSAWVTSVSQVNTVLDNQTRCLPARPVSTVLTLDRLPLTASIISAGKAGTVLVVRKALHRVTRKWESLILRLLISLELFAAQVLTAKKTLSNRLNADQVHS